MVRIIVTILFIFTSLLSAFESGDYQYWNGMYANKNVNGSVELHLSEMIKWGGNMSNLFLHRTDFGLKYEVSERVQVSANYKQVNTEREDKWYAYNTPYFSITINFNPSFILLENRHQIEYWFANEKNDYGRYRNKIKIIPQIGHSRFPFDLYLAEETFIMLNSEGINKLRFYMGIDFELFKGKEMGLYYCLQQTETEIGWNNYHVLGTSIKLLY